jgi:hypothetical protein
MADDVVFTTEDLRVAVLGRDGAARPIVYLNANVTLAEIRVICRR